MLHWSLNECIWNSALLSLHKLLLNSLHLPYSIQDGPKNELFLGFDNFAMVNERKVYDMSKVSEFFRRTSHMRQSATQVVRMLCVYVCMCVCVCGNFFSKQPLSPSWFDGSRWNLAWWEILGGSILEKFRWTLDHFFREHKFSIADISGNFQPITTKFCMVWGFVE